jgi:hypothetical protein
LPRGPSREPDAARLAPRRARATQGRPTPWFCPGYAHRRIAARERLGDD